MSEKLAWPFDLDAVSAELQQQIAAAPDEATRVSLQNRLGRITAGRNWLRRGARTLRGVGRGTEALVRGAERLLSPVEALGGAALKGLGSAGEYVTKSPRLLTGLGVGALAAPILIEEGSDRYNRVTNRILRARQDPRRMVEERDVMASLNEFLEKKAAAFLSPTVRTGLRDNAIKGLASGAGSEVASALVYGLGRAASGIGSALFGDPQKKAILEKILATDQIISDALKRNPAVKDQIMEAYQTLNRFAPSLAADVNAVRSFLREVVLGGGHVNYATIKNLIDTEKSLHGDVPKYKGMF